MTIAASLLPEWVQTDGRYATSGYDANLVAWPATKFGTYDLTQKSGWASASKTVTKGPDVNGATTGPALIVVVYDDVFWWLKPNTATTLPQFLIDLLSVAGSPYTLT